MMQHCIIVVLYKTRLFDAPTIRSLVKCKAELTTSLIWIWDNSDTAVDQEELEKLKGDIPGIYYKHTPDNTSLSKIYNTVIAESRNYSHLILLDQDSSFDETYFKSLSQAFEQAGKINLFVPVIKHAGRIMSPGYFYNFRGAYRRKLEPGINTSKNMCVISSGICISFAYLNGRFAGFNEDFSFYGIDTFFSTQYRKDNDEFFVLDCHFEHSLSVNENESAEVKLRRFEDHKKSLLMLTRQSGIWVKLMSRIYILLQVIKFKLRRNSYKDASIT